MRVVGVSRVLDEADVIEPFIRHHAALLDLPIVLDNGSSDGTVEILRALHEEGVALQVYQTVAQSHGAILDAKRLIKREIIQRGQEVRRLF